MSRTYTYREDQGKVIENWCKTSCPNAMIEHLESWAVNPITFRVELNRNYRFTFPNEQEYILFKLKWR